MQTTASLPMSRLSDLVIQESGSELLIFDLRTNRAHCLNQSAAAVWRGCSEGLSSSAMKARLADEMGIKVGDDFIQLALDQLKEFDLLESPSWIRVLDEKVTRREVLKKYAIAAAVPLIFSVVAPPVIHAISCIPPGGPCASSAQCCSGLCVVNMCA